MKLVTARRSALEAAVSLLAAGALTLTSGSAAGAQDEGCQKAGGLCEDIVVVGKYEVEPWSEETEAKTPDRQAGEAGESGGPTEAAPDPAAANAAVDKALRTVLDGLIETVTTGCTEARASLRAATDRYTAAALAFGYADRELNHEATEAALSVVRTWADVYKDHGELDQLALGAALNHLNNELLAAKVLLAADKYHDAWAEVQASQPPMDHAVDQYYSCLDAAAAASAANSDLSTEPIPVSEREIDVALLCKVRPGLPQCEE